MKLRPIAIALLFSTGIFAATAHALTGSAGTTSGDFLKMGVGARYLAMGEAATAAADDANAIFWNPANLARLQRPSLSVMYGASLEPYQYHAAAFGQPAGPAGTFGLAFQTLSVGAIQQTNDMAQTLGDFSPRDSAGTLGWGRTFFSGLSSILPPIDAGINVKFVQSKIINTASTLTGDAGIGFHTRRFAIGSSVQNIGGKLKFDQVEDPLPLMVRLGIAYKLTPNWLWSIDGSKPKGGNAMGAAGTEYAWPFKNGTGLALRGGFNTRAQDVPGMVGLSAGMGFKLPFVRIDYAWTSLGDLGQAHRVSMTIPFGRTNAVPAKTAAAEPEVKPAQKEKAAPPVDNKSVSVSTKTVSTDKSAVAPSTGTAKPPEMILRRGDALHLPPALAEIASQKDTGVTFVLHSAFDPGKATLGYQVRSTLNDLSKIFELYPKNKIMVEGHTNSLGNTEYNKILSLERALAVGNYFIDNLDFPSDHFMVKGLGAAQPIAPNTTEEGRQANVRVEITILYDQSPAAKP